MGIKAAGSNVRLNDFAEKLIGLKYLGEDVTVPTSYGTRVAARAQVVDLEAKRNHGETLVFQQAIANEVRASGSDWTVGVLREQAHEKYADGTMFVLDSEGIDLEAAAAAFEEAGVSTD